MHPLVTGGKRELGNGSALWQQIILLALKTTKETQKLNDGATELQVKLSTEIRRSENKPLNALWAFMQEVLELL